MIASDIKLMCVSGCVCLQSYGIKVGYGGGGAGGVNLSAGAAAPKSGACCG